MSRQNFKQFTKWLRDNKLILARCNCGMYDNEHDVDCALVLSEENLFEKWKIEMAGKAESVV